MHANQSARRLTRCGKTNSIDYPGFDSTRLKGFTLIEMLLALLILAVAVSSASLALRPDPARQLEVEAERLALLLTLAREESDLGLLPLGWVAQETGYAFQRRELTESGQEWHVLRNDELFRPRTLPAGVHIHAVLTQGRLLTPGERLDLGPSGPQSVVVELVAGPLRARVERSGADFIAMHAREGS